MTADPEVCHGMVCIAGTRVMASNVLDCLAEGMSRDEILEQYPSSQDADITATSAPYGWTVRHTERIK